MTPRAARGKPTAAKGNGGKKASALGHNAPYMKNKRHSILKRANASARKSKEGYERSLRPRERPQTPSDLLEVEQEPEGGNRKSTDKITEAGT